MGTELDARPPWMWPFSCALGLQGLSLRDGAVTSSQSQGQSNPPEGMLSWPENPGMTPETRGWRDVMGRTEGREGSLDVAAAAPTRAPVPCHHQAVITPTEPQLIRSGFRSSSQRLRQRGVFEGGRRAQGAFPAFPRLEDHGTEHCVLLTEASSPWWPTSGR